MLEDITNSFHGAVSQMLEQSQMQQLLALVTGFSGSHKCHQVMKSFAGGVDDTVLVRFLYAIISPLKALQYNRFLSREEGVQSPG